MLPARAHACRASLARATHSSRRWAAPAGARRGARSQHGRSQVRRARAWTLAVAAWGGSGGGDTDGWQNPAGGERLRLLTQFVQEADPSIMSKFESEAHPSVLIAMRQTITSMLGTLPPQFFRVVISTEAENLAQLMYSVLMSGYMFANAWTRLSLTQSMAELPLRGLLEPELASLNGLPVGPNGLVATSPSSSSSSILASLDDAAYAPGTQKVRVEGEVLRWHHEDGKEVIPALAYIEQLELELEELRQQVEAHQAEQRLAAASGLQPPPGNELLDYLKCLSPEELVALTDCASEDVLEAMSQFVQRLMGMEEEALQGGTTDCTADELAQLMYWLMITGYSLRLLEQRCDLMRTLDLPSPGDGQPPSLPP